MNRSTASKNSWRCSWRAARTPGGVWARPAKGPLETRPRRFFQLADAFAWETGRGARLAQRVRLVAVEAEAKMHDGPQTRVQALERDGDALAIVTRLRERERRGGRAVG